MNYFAHGRCYTDRPYFLAGTAVPDWLGLCERKVRVRRQSALECRENGNGAGGAAPATDVAAGIVQHLDDDRWFHRTPAFVRTSALLAKRIRAWLPEDRGVRPGFLGHILTEMLLDRVLIERDPSALSAYYAAIQRVDANEVQAAVNRMSREPTRRLAMLIQRFCEERFLQDYPHDARLLYRMNQVMRRVQLPTLPDDFADLLPEMRGHVAEAADELLRLVPEGR